MKHDIQHCKEINGVKIDVIKTQREVDEAIDFYFKHFLEDEPSSKSKGGSSVYYKDGVRNAAIEKDVRAYLDYGVSLQARDGTTNDLIGIRISFTSERSDEEEHVETLEELLDEFPAPYAVMEHMVRLARTKPCHFQATFR